MFHALPEHFASARWRSVPSLHLSHRLLCRFPRRVRGARHLWRTLKTPRSTTCDLSTASFGLDAIFIERVHRPGDPFLISCSTPPTTLCRAIRAATLPACGESIHDVLSRPRCRRRVDITVVHLPCVSNHKGQQPSPPTTILPMSSVFLRVAPGLSTGDPRLASGPSTAFIVDAFLGLSIDRATGHRAMAKRWLTFHAAIPFADLYQHGLHTTCAASSMSHRSMDVTLQRGTGSSNLTIVVFVRVKLALARKTHFQH